MSRSPVDLEESTPAELESYAGAVTQLSRMIQSGRSLSGRERHCSFLNTGGAQFGNISATSGLDFQDDGRGMAAVDWDHDGDQDLWISNRTGPRLRFLRNETDSKSQFIGIRLSGNGTSCNRDGIGARLELRAGGVLQLRTLKAGEGYLSQSSKWLHFGLGLEGSIDSLVVRWPDGSEQGFQQGLEPNKFYSLAQGGQPTEYDPSIARRGSRSKLVPSVAVARKSTDTMRLPLASRTPVPRLTYRDLDDQQRQVREHLEQPLLLNLWASWCAPCRSELAEFEAADMHVLALSVDGIGELGEPQDEGVRNAREFLSEQSFEFETGFADAQLIGSLQFFHDAMFINRKALPLPTSFLIDTDGTVGAIYKGTVTPEQVREDMAHLRDEADKRRKRAIPHSGRWLQTWRNLEATEFGSRLVAEDRLDEAIQYLDEFASPTHPLLPKVLSHLAARLNHVGRADEAQAIAAKAERLSQPLSQPEPEGD